MEGSLVAGEGASNELPESLVDGWRDGWAHAQDPPYQQGDSDIEQQRDCLGVCEWAAAGVGVSACGTGWEVTAH